MTAKPKSKTEGEVERLLSKGGENGIIGVEGVVHEFGAGSWMNVLLTLVSII